MPDLCTAAPGGIACGRLAIATVVTGCVHEHLVETPVCQRHRDLAADGRMLCGPCAEAGCTHCEARLLRETVNG